MRTNKAPKLKTLKVTRLKMPLSFKTKAHILKDNAVQAKVLEVIEKMKALDNETGLVSWTSPVGFSEQLYSEEQRTAVVKFFNDNGFPTSVVEGELRVFR